MALVEGLLSGLAAGGAGSLQPPWESPEAGVATGDPASSPTEEAAGPTAFGDDDDGQGADFSADTWDPPSQKYGLLRLLRLGQALSAPKPSEMEHLKFLICRSLIAAESDNERDYEARDRRNREDRGDRERKGKGRGSKQGRNVHGMGKTEIIPGSQAGQWWRNIGIGQQLDVIVRENISLQSRELWKVPPGHFVQQSGPCEVLVSGPAVGLQRMPVKPRGWVTVDATLVGGPKYLAPVSVPRWKVVFSSGASRGDIVVRELPSLESEEVAVLLCGTLVEQTGPQEILEDGIVRMPITFAQGVGREPSSPSQPPKCRHGWVTCDATSQGGPRFFEPCDDEELEQPPRAPEPAQQDEVGAAGGGEEGGDVAGPAATGSVPWTKTRRWRVAIEDASNQGLAILSRAEPFAPGTGKVPPEDIVVRWLNKGDVVEQMGHSKKMRTFMVMPVKLVAVAGQPLLDPSEQVEGYVTRRGAKDQSEAWFVEVGERRSRRHEAAEHSSHRADLEDRD